MILLDMKDYFYLLVNVDSDSVDDIVKVRRCSKRHSNLYTSIRKFISSKESHKSVVAFVCGSTKKPRKKYCSSYIWHSACCWTLWIRRRLSTHSCIPYKAIVGPEIIVKGDGQFDRHSIWKTSFHVVGMQCGRHVCIPHI